MKFIQLHQAGGDCTAPFLVTDIKATTVAEFVGEILKENPNEWGYIGINDGKYGFGNPNCEYRYGQLLNSLPNEILSKKIEKVTSSGGWSRMDYLISIKL